MQAPAGFAAYSEGGHHWIVRNDLAAALRPLMAQPFAQLARTPGARPMPGGRAGPLTIHSPRADEELLIRPYARGGWLGDLLGRTRVGPDRPRQELAVTMRARDAGLPVPEPVGITADCRRAGFTHQWTFESWSVLIRGARPLPGLLREAGPSVLPAIATALRRCMDGGLWHPDLNSRNIIAGQEGAWRAWVVDLDRTRFLPPLNARQRLALLKRLHRSLAKEGVSPVPVGDREFSILVNACLGEPLQERDMVRFLASCRRSVFWHSLLWRRS